MSFYFADAENYIMKNVMEGVVRGFEKGEKYVRVSGRSDNKMEKKGKVTKVINK